MDIKELTIDLHKISLGSLTPKEQQNTLDHAIKVLERIDEGKIEKLVCAEKNDHCDTGCTDGAHCPVAKAIVSYLTT